MQINLNRHAFPALISEVKVDFRHGPALVRETGTTPDHARGHILRPALVLDLGPLHVLEQQVSR